MKRSGKRSTRKLTLLGLMATVALALGCAGTTPPAPDVNRLLAAGFKVVPAKTKEQQEHLQALPRGQLTEWQRTGKHFFVYPDVASNQLYVGTPKEYEAYRRLGPAASRGYGVLQQARCRDADVYEPRSRRPLLLLG